jgi:hypothetical protein
MSNLTIAAAFTKNTSQPAQALALADIDLYLTRQNNSTLVCDIVWNGSQNPTVEVDNVGYYTRLYSGANLDTYTYYARASYTGATVLDSDHVTGTLGRAEATLTTAGATLAAALSGTTVTIRRGDSLSLAITGLGDISARTMLWFSVKTADSQADTAAIIQIEETAGLVYLNGTAAGTPANGSITVDDAVAGDITVALDEVETDDLVPNSLTYDVQMLAGGDVTTLTEGIANIVADITRAVA